MSRANGAASSALELYLGPSPGLLAFVPGSGRVAAGDLLVDGYPDFAFVETVGTQTRGLLLRNDFAIGGSLVAVPAFDVGALDVDAWAAAADLGGTGGDDVLIGVRGEPVGVSDVFLDLGGNGQFGHARQLLAPGLLLDIDGDGDRDVVGERIVFNLQLP